MYTPPVFSLCVLLTMFGVLLLIELGRMIYFTKFHTLKKIPGPWFPAASSLWIRWQRWHGKLSFTADDLLSQYGPIVRISPNIVLVNDYQALNSISRGRI